MFLADRIYSLWQRTYLGCALMSVSFSRVNNCTISELLNQQLDRSSEKKLASTRAEMFAVSKLYWCAVKSLVWGGILLLGLTDKNYPVLIYKKSVPVAWLIDTGWAKKNKLAYFCSNSVTLALIHYTRKFATGGYTVRPPNTGCVTTLPGKILTKNFFMLNFIHCCKIHVVQFLLQ